MMIILRSAHFLLTPENNEQLNNLCGQLDEHLRQIERALAVEIAHRGHHFKITGPALAVKHAGELIQSLYANALDNPPSLRTINLALQTLSNRIKKEEAQIDPDKMVTLKTPCAQVTPRGLNQQRYLKRVQKSDINFGIGPAGTGKTYLAVACAVSALEADHVKRIILVRPAVEAGENLGFLPGDLAQKVDPYLRPMYDALYELMGLERATKLIEQHTIEVAPLAFMRGRSLNDAFIILDESQNTTREQMKMFLTRIGFNSKVVVTGDITQVDLPKGKHSGLRDAIHVLENVKDISFTFFDSGDVVRHPLVQRVVEAYESQD